MKKIITISLILISSALFSQTYKSSKVITNRGFKSEKHTIKVDPDKVVFDGKIFNVSKLSKVKGAMPSDTYHIKDGGSFTFVYRNSKVIQVACKEVNGDDITITVIFKPKEIK